MQRKSLGLIEAEGLLGGITAADAAVKSANVVLIGYEFARGGGWTTVKVMGDVGAVKAAVAAGSVAASKVCRVVSAHVIPRPSDGLVGLIHNAATVGDTPPEPPAPPAPPAAPKSEPEPEPEPEPAQASEPMSEPVPEPEPTKEEEVVPTGSVEASAPVEESVSGSQTVEVAKAEGSEAAPSEAPIPEELAAPAREAAEPEKAEPAAAPVSEQPSVPTPEQSAGQKTSRRRGKKKQA